MVGLNKFILAIMFVSLSGLHTSAMADPAKLSVLDKTKIFFSHGAEVVAEKSSQAWHATKRGTRKAKVGTIRLVRNGWSKTRETGKKVAAYTRTQFSKLRDRVAARKKSEPPVADLSTN